MSSRNLPWTLFYSQKKTQTFRERSKTTPSLCAPKQSMTEVPSFRLTEVPSSSVLLPEHDGSSVKHWRKFRQTLIACVSLNWRKFRGPPQKFRQWLTFHLNGSFWSLSIYSLHPLREKGWRTSLKHIHTLFSLSNSPLSRSSESKPLWESQSIPRVDIHS